MKSRRFQIRDSHGDVMHTLLPIDHWELMKLSVLRPLQSLEVGEGTWCLSRANDRVFVERIG